MTERNETVWTDDQMWTDERMDEHYADHGDEK